MAKPTTYNRGFNFSNFQSQNPTSPLPGSSLDQELARIKRTLDELIANLSLIQRDDTALANLSVGFDQLKTELSIGVNPPTTWATATNYVKNDSVFRSQKFYIAAASHVSGVFATDLGAGKWTEIADFTAAQDALLVVYDNAESGLAATNLQDAVDEIAGSINVSSVFGRSGAVVATTSDYDANQIDFNAAGLTHTDADDVQEAIADHDARITALGVFPGTILDYAGSTAPSGYLFCFGQTVSRATYAALFAAIGTAFGAGDGSTTFGLPDCRGRVVAGKDDMGGASANRLTNQSGGLNGDTLGATGGAETHTLLTAQIPAHNHTASAGAAGSHNHSYSVVVNAAGTAFAAFDSGGATLGYLTSNTGNEPDHTHSVTVNNAGGGTAHNNVQPTIIFNKIIKT